MPAARRGCWAQRVLTRAARVGRSICRGGGLVRVLRSRNTLLASGADPRRRLCRAVDEVDGRLRRATTSEQPARRRFGLDVALAAASHRRALARSASGPRGRAGPVARSPVSRETAGPRHRSVVQVDVAMGARAARCVPCPLVERPACSSAVSLGATRCQGGARGSGTAGGPDPALGMERTVSERCAGLGGLEAAQRSCATGRPVVSPRRLFGEADCGSEACSSGNTSAIAGPCRLISSPVDVESWLMPCGLPGRRDPPSHTCHPRAFPPWAC